MGGGADRLANLVREGFIGESSLEKKNSFFGDFMNLTIYNC